MKKIIYQSLVTRKTPWRLAAFRAQQYVKKQLLLAALFGLFAATGFAQDELKLKVDLSISSGQAAGLFFMRGTGTVTIDVYDATGSTLLHSYGSVPFQTTVNNADFSGVTDVQIWYGLGITSFTPTSGTSSVGKITDILQWGNSTFSQLNFYRANALTTISATDSPNFAANANLSWIFRDCPLFNDTNANLNTWDISNVTTLQAAFYDSPLFNAPLSNWDVTGVTDLDSMFGLATAFNQDISSWKDKVANVTTTRNMFISASNFNNGNEDMPDFNWASCTTFEGMFNAADAFNAVVTGWQFSTDPSVNINMYQMFRNADLFNQDISSWNFERVQSTQQMFIRSSGVTAFNNGGQPLINLDFSNCISFRSMFQQADAFNVPVTGWTFNQAAAVDMSLMFYLTDLFNQDISTWGATTNKVTSTIGMFQQATAFNNGGAAMDGFDWSDNITFQSMFYLASDFNASVENWTITTDPLKNVDMYRMFLNTTSFNKSVSSWDFQRVFRTQSMFQESAFNNGDQPFENEDFGNCTDFKSMFQSADAFNVSVTNWTFNQAAAVDMSLMFYLTDLFNQDISTWGATTNKVTSTQSMFQQATAFNNGEAAMDGFDWSDNISFRAMFYLAADFNASVENWTITTDASKDVDMLWMFLNTTSFNQSISSWDFQRVWRTQAMFQGSVFNNGDQPFENEDFGNCTDFKSMFQSADAFNVSVTNWTFNQAAAVDMSLMFYLTDLFNQDISTWGATTNKVTSTQSMFQQATAFNNGEAAMDGFDWSDNISFRAMFYLAADFNASVENWTITTDASKDVDMLWMFLTATSFNQSVSSWDFQRVYRTQAMFQGSAFNNGDLPLDNVNLSNVTDASSMFRLAVSFNQALTGWSFSTTAGSVNMNTMFDGATLFDQSLATMNISGASSMTNFISSTGLSQDNYDATLTGWDLAGYSPTATSFGATGLTYCNSFASRSSLIGKDLMPTGDALGCTPAGLPSTKYWLSSSAYSDTEGAAQEVFYDQSGSGFDFNQSTAINQPVYSGTDHINFNPLFKFDGVDDFMATSNALTNSTINFTVLGANRSASSEQDPTLSAASSLSNSTTAWVPATAANTEFITLDLGAVSPVDGLTTKGRADDDNWTSTYTVSHSIDDVTYTPLGTTFTGNNNRNAGVTQSFAATVAARYIRIFPQTWNVQPALRVEAFHTANTAITAFVVSKEDVRQNNTTLSLGYTDTDNQFAIRQPDATGNLLFEGIVGGVTEINQSAPITAAVGVPTIATYTNNFAANTSSIYQNGSLATSGTGAIVTTGTQLLGGNAAESTFFNGKIAEAVVFPSVFSDVNLTVMHTYLSIKYGVPVSNDLDNNGTVNEVISGTIKEGDYLASDGATVLWTYDANTDFNNNVFGIARDDDGGLNQKVSKAVATNAILTVATQDDFTSLNNAITRTQLSNDLSFVLTGENMGTNTWTSTMAPNNFQVLNKQWKTQVTGTINDIYLEFNVDNALFDVPELKSGADYYLIVDAANDGFANDTPTILTNTGGTLWSSAATLANGNTFTLATPFISSPGGVDINLALWLKADAGTDTTTNGVAVDTWQDQSVNAYEADKANNTNRPTFSSDNVNFNPSLNFGAGTNDIGFDLGTDFIYAPAANGGMHIFSVVNPSATGARKFIYDFGEFATANIGLAISNTQVVLAEETSNEPLGGVSQLSIVEGEFNFGAQKHINIDGKSAFDSTMGWSEITALQIKENSTPSSTSGPVSIGRQSKTGLDADGGRRFFGDMGEVIVYNADITDTQAQQVRSYLALKYGTSLDQTGADGTDALGDYLASDGSTLMWDAPNNAAGAYNQDIFGIGRDDASALNQKVSKSENADGILMVALDNDFEAANNNATSRLTEITEDLNFLTFANNGADATSWVANELCACKGHFRIAREWQVQKVGVTPGINDTVFMGIAATDLPAGVPSSADVYLIVDKNGDFSDAPYETYKLTLNNGTYSAAIPLVNGDFITIAYVNPTSGRMRNGKFWLFGKQQSNIKN